MGLSSRAAHSACGRDVDLDVDDVGARRREALRRAASAPRRAARSDARGVAMTSPSATESNAEPELVASTNVRVQRLRA